MCNRPDEANMICYDCSRDSVNKDAVGFCNCCSGGISRKHAVEVDKLVIVMRAINREEMLSIHTLVSAV